MNCTWDAIDTVITMVCVAGRRGWIVFDSDLTLITVDTHIPMLGWMLRGRDSICFCLVLMPLHGVGCVFAAGGKYAARRCDDAERVARAYGECVRHVYDDCSR